jgi:hypothetical protein
MIFLGKAGNKPRSFTERAASRQKTYHFWQTYTRLDP